jgi:hypothetical protein
MDAVPKCRIFVQFKRAGYDASQDEFFSRKEVFLMESPENIRAALAQAIGTENYWRAFPNNDSFLFTDGVKVMAEMCEAFWLVTAVFSWQCVEKVRKEAFQVWKLRLEKEDSAVLTCEDGNGRELARQEIEFTDFPLPEGMTLYLDGGVLLLPSEY